MNQTSFAAPNVLLTLDRYIVVASAKVLFYFMCCKPLIMMSYQYVMRGQLEVERCYH